MYFKGGWFYLQIYIYQIILKADLRYQILFKCKMHLGF